MTWSQQAGDNSNQIQVGGTQPTDQATGMSASVARNAILMLGRIVTATLVLSIVAYFSGRWAQRDGDTPWVFLAPAAVLYAAIMFTLYRLRKRLNTSAVRDPDASSRMPGNENTS